MCQAWSLLAWCPWNPQIPFGNKNIGWLHETTWDGCPPQTCLDAEWSPKSPLIHTSKPWPQWSPFFRYYFHWLALFDETWQTSWPWHYWPLWLPKNYHPSLGFISFTLPMHKADWFFKGSTIMLEQHASLLDPLPVFQRYLTSCNQLFGPLPELWLKSDSCVPMRSWFISKLKKLFPEEDVSGHSLWSGGATALALASVLLNQFQLISHWSSEAFLFYIHQNPTLLQSSITGQPAFKALNTSSQSLWPPFPHPSIHWYHGVVTHCILPEPPAA